MVVALTMLDRPMPVVVEEMAAAVLEALDMEVQERQALLTLAVVLVEAAIVQ